MSRGLQPTCHCGSCKRCKHRVISARYYHRHTKLVIAKNLSYSRIRRRRNREDVSDEELDARANAAWERITAQEGGSI